jgi:hypothetical protein
MPRLFAPLSGEVGAVGCPMRQNQIEEGRISQHSRGLGTITEDMVRERARELAITNGRSPDHLSEADLAQAKRELVEAPLAPEAPEGAAAEALPESERWDPNRGSMGRKAPVYPAHDEQTDVEKLVEEGVEEAEHDQMVEGTRESLRRET